MKYCISRKLKLHLKEFHNYYSTPKEIFNLYKLIPEEFNGSSTSWGMQLAQFDVAGKMFSMVIATIQIHATRVAFNWEIQMLILKFGFQILQSNTKSENGFHL